VHVLNECYSFSTRGPAPGAILMEWNIKGSSQGAAGMWDSHLRIGGTAGTNLQSGQCPTGSQNSACLAAFMGLHLTSSSSAYLEGTWVSLHLVFTHQNGY
jgi:glucan 1,3-beta-glucosidase